MKKVILFVVGTFLHALAQQIPSTATLQQNTDLENSQQDHHSLSKLDIVKFTVNLADQNYHTIAQSSTKRLEQSVNVTWCVDNTNGN